jgi:branched-chain amino acid aminotransferase
VAADTVVLVDGEQRDPSAPAVPPLDPGLLGHGVYESIRTYGGVPFALDRHLDRLADGAAALGIACPRDELARDVPAAVAARAASGETRIQLKLTAGGVRIVVADALPDRRRDRADGLRARCLPWRRDPGGPTMGVKASSTAAVRVAQRWLADHGAAVGIWLTSDECVVEALAANVFAVVRGVLVTPPLADGPLGGVTREHLLAWAAEDGLVVEERSLPRAVLAGADEALVSATSEPVVPLVALDGEALGDGRPGSVTRRLQELFEARARASLAGAQGANASG